MSNNTTSDMEMLWKSFSKQVFAILCKEKEEIDKYYNEYLLNSDSPDIISKLSERFLSAYRRVFDYYYKHYCRIMNGIQGGAFHNAELQLDIASNMFAQINNDIITGKFKEYFFQYDQKKQTKNKSFFSYVTTIVNYKTRYEFIKEYWNEKNRGIKKDQETVSLYNRMKKELEERGFDATPEKCRPTLFEQCCSWIKDRYPDDYRNKDNIYFHWCVMTYISAPIEPSESDTDNDNQDDFLNLDSIEFEMYADRNDDMSAIDNKMCIEQAVKSLNNAMKAYNQSKEAKTIFSKLATYTLLKYGMSEYPDTEDGLKSLKETIKKHFLWFDIDAADYVIDCWNKNKAFPKKTVFYAEKLKKSAKVSIDNFNRVNRYLLNAVQMPDFFTDETIKEEKYVVLIFLLLLTRQ